MHPLVLHHFRLAGVVRGVLVVVVLGRFRGRTQVAYVVRYRGMVPLLPGFFFEGELLRHELALVGAHVRNVLAFRLVVNVVGLVVVVLRGSRFGGKVPEFVDFRVVVALLPLFVSFRECL